MPLVAALHQRGWDAEVVRYTDAAAPTIEARVAASADAFLTRVNPGSYPGYTEAAFLGMARRLHAAGVHALQHPDAMLCYGAKDSLVKLRHLAPGLPDTYVYYDHAAFLQAFPTNLAQVGGCGSATEGESVCAYMVQQLVASMGF